MLLQLIFTNGTEIQHFIKCEMCNFTCIVCSLARKKNIKVYEQILSPFIFYLFFLTPQTFIFHLCFVSVTAFEVEAER